MEYTNNMKKENIINYVVGISSVLLVALLGWVFVDMGMDWFNGLNKPSEWIPNAIIPIVWTIIYSAFILYIIHLVRKEKDNKRIIALLIVNGVLNVLWCLIYFALNSLLGGQVIIILNLIMVFMIEMILWIC